MATNSSDLRGVVHGKTIELEQEPGLPDGQKVFVTVKPVENRLPPGEGIRRSGRAAGRMIPKGGPLLEEMQNIGNWIVRRSPDVLPDRHRHLFHAFSAAHRSVTIAFTITGRLHISVLTLGELLSWTLRRNSPPKYQQALVAMLSDVVVLEVTADIAWRFGEVRAELLDPRTPLRRQT